MALHTLLPASVFLPASHAFGFLNNIHRRSFSSYSLGSWFCSPFSGQLRTCKGAFARRNFFSPSHIHLILSGCIVSSPAYLPHPSHTHHHHWAWLIIASTADQYDRPAISLFIDLSRIVCLCSSIHSSPSHAVLIIPHFQKNCIRPCLQSNLARRPKCRRQKGILPHPFKSRLRPS